MNPVDPWYKLEPGDARRVNSEGRFDFFWVIPEAGTLGLMLLLPSTPSPAPKLPKLKNISISFRQSGTGYAFILVLADQSQTEIFEKLCQDVVSAAEEGIDISDALSRAINRTQRWHIMLRSGHSKGLSIEEQRGLVGELAFLRDLVDGLGPETAIEAWTGPLGSAKDFELIGACIEVKTRRSAAKPFVTISSADQLADVPGSKLFLRVTRVSSAILPSGKSLHDHVKMTAKLFVNSTSAFDNWEEAIYSTGYDPLNSYDDRRWKLGDTDTYEVIPNFPRLVPPLPAGIENLRYSLSLDACAPYLNNEDLLLIIKRGLTE
ncbi:MAG: PD-(D/E)XK motif protein [Pseudohongiella sp.]|nr:PD-(D/E)XK motif protein [Pseudohongiella sp.]